MFRREPSPYMTVTCSESGFGTRGFPITNNMFEQSVETMLTQKIPKHSGVFNKGKVELYVLLKKQNGIFPGNHNIKSKGEGNSYSSIKDKMLSKFLENKCKVPRSEITAGHGVYFYFECDD